MKYTFILFLFFLNFTFSTAQSVTISPGDTQASIISNSTNNGIVPPRMNYSQILSIASPVEGTFVYDTEFKCLRVYNGSKWVCLNERLPAPNEPQGNFVGSEYGNTYLNQNFGYYTLTYGGYPISINVDTFNNYIVTYANTYRNSIYPSSNDRTIIVQKLSPSFDILWTKSLGTFGFLFDTNTKIATTIDSQNNVYLTGYAVGTYNFGDGPVAYSSPIMFLVKYDSDGVFQFKKIASGGYCKGNDIEIDGNGDIYVVGEYSGTVTFQDSPLSSLTSVSASKDGFIAKYNSIGEIVWVVSVGGNGNDYAAKLEIAGTSIAVGGYFAGNASFGNSISKTSLGSTDIFVLKLSTSGSAVWVNTIGGTGLENFADITMKTNGEINVYGDIFGTLNYFANPSTTTSQTIGASSQADLFLVKYFSSGALESTPILIGGPNYEVAASMVMNSSGDLYLTGSVGENFTFGGKTILAGGFILKYGSMEKWAVSGPQQKGVDICVNSNSQVFVTGQILKTKNYFIGNYLTPIADRCYIWKYSE